MSLSRLSVARSWQEIDVPIVGRWQCYFVHLQQQILLSHSHRYGIGGTSGHNLRQPKIKQCVNFLFNRLSDFLNFWRFSRVFREDLTCLGDEDEVFVRWQPKLRTMLRHWCRSCAVLAASVSVNSSRLQSSLTLCIHFFLGLPWGRLLEMWPQRRMCGYLSGCIRETCPKYVILRFWRSSMRLRRCPKYS